MRGEGSTTADAPTGRLIAETKRLTGITDHALARKLGVAVERLRACESESSPAALPPPALTALRAFHALATSRGAAAGAPRVASPPAAEGVQCGDCLELLRALPDASIDAIVSDIPYGIALDDWDVLHDNANSALLGSSEAQRRAGRVFARRRKPINGWSAADRAIPRQYQAWCASWAGEWLRVLKPGGSAVVFAGRRMAPRCVQAMEEAGFNFRDMIAWLRPRATFRAQRLSTVLQKRGELAEAKRWQGWRVGNLAPAFEPILWCFKPYDTTLADNVLDHGVGAMDVDAWSVHAGGFDNVIEAGLAPGEGGLHEAQKPVALMRALIELTTPRGALVLDPFAGSGTTGVAALQSGRRCLLMERSPAHAQTARERIALPG